MTETPPEYNTSVIFSRPWLCENCGYRLGMVVGGEITPHGEVTLRPESARVICPQCGHANAWHFAEKACRSV